MRLIDYCAAKSGQREKEAWEESQSDGGALAGWSG